MLTIRPFEPTMQAYEDAAKIMNLQRPHFEATADGLREFDQYIVTDDTFARFIGEVDDQIMAVTSYGQPPRLFGTDKYILEIDLHPSYNQAVYIEKLYDPLVIELQNRNAITILTEARETDDVRIQFLEDRHFELVMREHNSMLDLTTFIPTPIQTASLEKIQKHQITIYTLAELQQHDSGWLAKLEALFWAFRKDIPSGEPPVRETLPQFQKRFERASFRADAWFVAVDETNGMREAGVYVGATHLWLNVDNVEKVRTGQTGVLSSHRRCGVATALKLRALDFAKQLGAKVVTTNNAANNPMFQINLSFGFKPEPAWLEYRKELIPSV
ncbi:MAG: GNAT family N-acetyltransferase [Chloroflexota bacterium]